MFENRELLIVTKHHKEKVIAPLFYSHFNLPSKVSSKFDTDLLGTFTGEVERLNDPLTTLRKKCLLGMESEGFDIAVASEGSFGPHPQYFFARAAHELAIFIDKVNDIEIVADEVTTNTNFNGTDINNFEDLLNFAELVKFPSHAIILRNVKDSNSDIFKGITARDELHDAYYFLLNKYGCVFAETDMRAMHNPTRMIAIEKVFEKLIVKLNNHCPKCNAVGFDIENVTRGLPCSRCGIKTRSILAHIYQCKLCSYTEDRIYPNHILTENPMYCDFCNP